MGGLNELLDSSGGLQSFLFDCPTTHPPTHPPTHPNKQERLEGGFRYLHASFRSAIETIALYGGWVVEENRASQVRHPPTHPPTHLLHPPTHPPIQAFARVYSNRLLLIKHHFPLYLSTSFFDYLGSVINYAAVGASVLWLSSTTHPLTPR